ncbi:hypothetical protein [Fictibacillus gelatini]|uniref:hypothetical protein n=1 Tax=Fictibacillus gelatini TaxID=225985 RepID=UPI000406C948|nr:hypothetical protein [Fictibacillus gelatini]
MSTSIAPKLASSVQLGVKQVALLVAPVLEDFASSNFLALFVLLFEQVIKKSEGER